MRRWMLVVLLVASVSRPATAQPPTNDSGNLFLRDCQAALENKSTEFLSVGYCFGYLDGLAEGEDLKLLPPPDVAKTAYGPQWKQWCEPSGVTKGQRVRVVVKYLTETPARLHEERLLLVREALEHAWPCFKR